MKIVELIIENYRDQLVVDLQDLLTVAKGNDIPVISTDLLVSQLQGLGHNINNNSIMTILNGNEFVQTATPEEVHLKQDDEAAVSGGTDARYDNEAHVASMAQQAAQASINDRI